MNRFQRPKAPNARGRWCCPRSSPSPSWWQEAQALNSNLHSARPDNLLRTILQGISAPAGKDVGFMPAFRHSLDDTQVAALASYMRSRYAPAEPAWQGLPATVARLRAAPGEH